MSAFLYLLFVFFHLSNQKLISKYANKLINFDRIVSKENSGSCGPNLIYSFQSNQLEIIGEGEMDDFDFNSEAIHDSNSTTTRDSFKNVIISVLISQDETTIGSYAF